MFLHKIFIKNTLKTLSLKIIKKLRTVSLRSDVTGSYKEKRVLILG